MENKLSNQGKKHSMFMSFGKPYSLDIKLDSSYTSFQHLKANVSIPNRFLPCCKLHDLSNYDIDLDCGILIFCGDGKTGKTSSFAEFFKEFEEKELEKDKFVSIEDIAAALKEGFKQKRTPDNSCWVRDDCYYSSSLELPSKNINNKGNTILNNIINSKWPYERFWRNSTEINNSNLLPDHPKRRQGLFNTIIDDRDHVSTLKLPTLLTLKIRSFKQRMKEGSCSELITLLATYLNRVQEVFCKYLDRIFKNINIVFRKLLKLIWATCKTLLLDHPCLKPIRIIPFDGKDDDFAALILGKKQTHFIFFLNPFHEYEKKRRTFNNIRQCY